MTNVTVSQSQSPNIIQPFDMNFFGALSKTMEGRKVTKLEWDDIDTYIFFVGEHLCIHKSDKCKDPGIYPLKVSLSDTNGKDWIVVDETILQ